jgi:hypothetical protein
MSDHIEVNGKKYFEESYLELANNNTRRAQEKIVALEWKPITPESLPKDGDEVGGFDSFPYVLDVVTYAAIKDYDTWRSRGMTHFRALNAPER